MQNLTDIDNAILREARRVEEDYRALGDHWTTHFIREMQMLNIRPPHHFPRATDAILEITESESAQSECTTGQEPFARWWFHTAMVQLARRKISRSLGNLIMVQELLARYSSDAIRLYLTGHHYRHIWQYDPAGLEAAERLASLLQTAVTRPVRPCSPLPFDLTSKPQAFMQALAHDLDTPKAVQIFSSFAEEILQATRAGQAVQAAQKTLRSMGQIFGPTP